MTREDLARFRTLKINYSAIGLEQGTYEPYFCTPADAEYIGSLGCDGVHFILLPGDERVFCVEPALGEPGTYVLPVAEDFRAFLSYILYCRDANPIAQPVSYTHLDVYKRQGVGCALTLDKLVNTEGSDILCFRPLEPRLEAGLYLVWKKYQVFTRAAEVFLEQLQQELP